VVRAFVFNSEGQILITQHRSGQPWVLPGGHVEPDETLHDAMVRELIEEFGIKASFFEIDSEEQLYHQGAPLHNLPLPLSIYELAYTDAHGKNKSRTEYIFLMETSETIKKTQDEEIVSYQWIDPDAFLEMKPNEETWDFYIQMLEKIIDESTLEA